MTEDELARLECLRLAAPPESGRHHDADVTKTLVERARAFYAFLKEDSAPARPSGGAAKDA